MYKIKFFDADIAKSHSVALANDNEEWVNLEIGQYVRIEDATEFLDPELANEVMLPWEAIVKID